MAFPDGTIDLRSDTVTRPTPEMRSAMAAAEVGDDVYGEDPTVNRLQEMAAEMVGKDAALFMPSGTMCNQVALRLLSRPGTEVVCGERAHVVRFEASGAAMNAGVQMHGVDDGPGFFTGDAVRAAVSPPPFAAETSLVCIENTSQAGFGRPWRMAEVEDVAGAAAGLGLPVHCDGARIFNAAVALGVTAAELAAPCTTVMFCVSKGLGAPVGSLLCGPADVMKAARRHRQRLGGGMRQAGVLAAAGIVALETGVERLAGDHVRAQRLAEALADRFPGSVDPATVETNMICASAGALPDKFLRRLSDQGILGGMLDPVTVRLVTHRDVDDADVERVIGAFDSVAP